MGIIGQRFRGFYPVIVDVETGGFSATENALLEIAAVTLDINAAGELVRGESFQAHLQVFPGLRCDPAALAFNGIDPTHPFRDARSEAQALHDIFQKLRAAQKQHECTRCVLVGHNAWFDLSFLNAAVTRNNIKRNPFHPFTSFDTATLGALACGQTVLAKACAAMGIAFDGSEAHSALYDAERTAELFCSIVNRWQQLGGWPLPMTSDETASHQEQNAGEDDA